VIAFSAMKQNAHCAYCAAGSTSMPICLTVDTVFLAVSIFIAGVLLRFLCF